MAVTINLTNVETRSNSIKREHEYITEKARVSEPSYTYSGSVITCGPTGTHATISAAFTAASSGDIIQLEDGIFDTAAEPSGYLLINDLSGKDVLIRGNSTDNTAVVIQQSAAASFCVRLRTCNGVTFKDLTITSNQSTIPLYINMGNGGNHANFENCIIENTSLSITQTIRFIDAANSDSSLLFKDCVINKSENASSYSMYSDDITDANATTYSLPFMFVNSVVSGSVAILDSSNFIAYDCYFKDGNLSSGVIFGADIAAPTFLEADIDIRCCSFSLEDGNNAHGVLIGRGVRNAYFVNNYVYIAPSTDVLDLGLILKSDPVTVGDVYIGGNYIEAPRPLYVKGGIRNKIESNTSISNWDGDAFGYGFELNNPDNPDGIIDSNENVVIKNNFIGILSGIGLTEDPAANPAIDSMRTCTFRDNKYQVPNGNRYMTNPNVNWGDRIDTWKQDVNSIIVFI